MARISSPQMNRDDALAPICSLMFARCHRGQAAVEFGLIAVVAIIVLVVGIQFATIGQKALALNQAAYVAARYAALNPNAVQGDVQCYVLGSGSVSGGGSCSSSAMASPTISQSSGKYVKLTMSPNSTRSFGSAVTISLTFDVCASGGLFLASNCGSFFGLQFPSTLTSTESAMTE
jgi:Flp pilus assembly protein TadG